MIDWRGVLLGTGASALLSAAGRPLVEAPEVMDAGPIVFVTEFGATYAAADNTRAIQAAIESVERRGGGTVVIPGRYRCGPIRILGRNVRLQGQGGWLVDGRLVIGREAASIEVADLGIVDTRGDRRALLMDVAGRNCRFTDVQLVKDPIAGGYQMYMRQQSAGCHFRGLRLKGSNGIMVAGVDHLFEDFELESTMVKHMGGDDAFAIKGLEATTENIVIRNGIVRGYAAIASFGSEIGTDGPASGRRGAVRNVTVENVAADRCTSLVFFKPGALIYDWRSGLVEGVRLRNLALRDRTGERFRSGIRIIAARGATIRDVRATGISIEARAKDRGVLHTAAIDIGILREGAPATIANVDLQMRFVDPLAGAPHGPRSSGYPIEHIVKIEKDEPRGTISGITFDIEGRGAAFGGILVGVGLDGAVDVRRAILNRVATDPPASIGGGGIWSESRLTLGEVTIDSVKLPKFGGRAFPKRHN